MTRVPEESDRLDSWKQIAAYLNKSERTVRRWSELEGLPVHKHQHLQKGSVWAFRSELDAWLAQRTVTAAPPAPASRKSWLVAPMLLAVVGIAWWAIDRKPAPLAKPVPFTALRGTEYGAAFSPDGKKVAFYWTGDGIAPSGIYVKEIGSEAIVKLVATGAAFEYGPAWSPDGKTIAFLRRTNEDGVWVWVIAASGGPERRLAQLSKRLRVTAENQHLAWSADGQRILATVYSEQGGLCWIDIADSTIKKVDGTVPGSHAPALAPDGKSVAYVLRTIGGPPSGPGDILLVPLNADGGAAGAPKTIYRGPGAVRGFAWTPGGDGLIVCMQMSQTSATLHRLRARPGSPLEPIGDASCSGVAISARGDLIYAASGAERGSLWRAPLNDLDRRERFAPSSRYDGNPEFSPDGKLVAFVSTRSGARTVWVAKADGTEPRQISDAAATGTLRWSPAGDRVLFGSIGAGLVTAPVTGGPLKKIDGAGAPVRWPHWDHARNLLYFTVQGTMTTLNPDTGAASEAGRFPNEPTVRTSADGSTMYWMRVTQQKWELLRQTGAASTERIAADVDLFFGASRTAVYFIDRNQILHAAAFAGGPPRRIGPLNVPDTTLRSMIGFSVSPDDSTIVFGNVQTTDTDLELVSGVR
ncbi:MAG: hypothetical protein FJW38_07490 [Acidobacteria bacterium]|nr:hypothetical protein [Acidobacteriota bacterium]